MVGASLAARRAEPTSCQHPFPSRGLTRSPSRRATTAIHAMRTAESTFTGHSRRRHCNRGIRDPLAHGSSRGHSSGTPAFRPWNSSADPGDPSRGYHSERSREVGQL